MGSFNNFKNKSNKIIDIVKNIDKKTLDKREEQNIDDIVFIDDLQVFFGGGGKDFEDKSELGLSGKMYSIGWDQLFSGNNPGRTSIEFLFWSLPDFTQTDENSAAFTQAWKLPKTGKYDFGIISILKVYLKNIL